MPPVSQAQRRWAFAAAEGKIPGTPKSVGVEFEGKGIKNLPGRLKINRIPHPGEEPLPKAHSSRHH